MSRIQLPYGKGVFRRRYRLVSGPGCVTADLEDDFHCFRAVVEHDGRRVSTVHGEALRYPWDACPGAIRRLRELEGLALPRSLAEAESASDPARHCTHLHDLACLALTHAAAGRSRRVYDAAVPDRRQGATAPTLARDGEPYLAWRVRGLEIEDPEPFRGVSLRGAAFAAWCAETLDPERAEAARILWRTCFIALGRKQDFDAFRVATDFMPVSKMSCHTFTAGVAERALRIPGTTREFTHAPDRLLSHSGSPGK